jgi:ABC-type antimicrobial peptide transport system permease subunit
MLHGVAPHDPSTYAVTAAAFMAVAVVSCGVPAARAARLHPVEAIRSE